MSGLRVQIAGWNLKLVLGQFVGLAVVYGIFAVAGAPPSLYSLDNTKLILVQTVIVAVGALGMTLIIISGGIDLSVGSVIALSAVTTAQAYQSWETLWIAVPVGILTGAAFGFLNGSLIVGLRIVPFIATLGTLGIARGLAKILAGNTTVNPPESALSSLMRVTRHSPAWDLPPGVWLLFGLALVVGFVLHYTVLGRYTFAIGSNESTARLCGVPVPGCKIGLYTLCGGLTGVAGVLMFGELSIGDPTVAVGKELDIIAATVIGGGSLAGGEGSVLGSLLGAFIMSLLRSGCVKMGWPNPVQEIVIGAIIILAVAIDQWRHRRARD